MKSGLVTKTWLATDILTIFLDGILFTLINFLIWEGQESLRLILEFNLVIFGTIAVFSLFGGFISIAIHPKLSFLVALITKLGLAFYVAMNFQTVSGKIVALAVLYGISYALVSASRSTLNESVMNSDDIVKFGGIKEALLSAASLLSPVLVKLGIDSLGYEVSFQLLALVFVLLALLHLLTPITRIPQRLKFPQIILSAFNSRGIGRVSLINLGLGMGAVFNWGLLNVMILQILGSLENWTYVSTGLAFAGIIFASLLGRIDVRDRRKAKTIIIVGLLVYAIGPMILLNEFSAMTFVIFTFLKLFYDKINQILTGAVISDVHQQDPEYEKHMVSYYTTNSFYSSLGMILPVVVLVMLPVEMITTEFLVIVLALLTFAPFFLSSVLQHGDNRMSKEG